MYDTLTMYKNHKKKVFCVHKESAAFSITRCQSITVPVHMMEFEIWDAEEQGFAQVDCYEFSGML